MLTFYCQRSDLKCILLVAGFVDLCKHVHFTLRCFESFCTYDFTLWINCIILCLIWNEMGYVKTVIEILWVHSFDCKIFSVLNLLADKGCYEFSIQECLAETIVHNTGRCSSFICEFVFFLSIILFRTGFYIADIHKIDSINWTFNCIIIHFVVCTVDQCTFTNLLSVQVIKLSSDSARGDTEPVERIKGCQSIALSAPFPFIFFRWQYSLHFSNTMAYLHFPGDSTITLFTKNFCFNRNSVNKMNRYVL